MSTLNHMVAATSSYVIWYSSAVIVPAGSAALF